jgi:hypothetical protein
MEMPNTQRDLLAIINDNNGREPLQVFKRASQSCPPFAVRGSPTKYPVIFRKELISKEEMSSFERSMRQRRIARGWDRFLNLTLPVLNKAVLTHFTI